MSPEALGKQLELALQAPAIFIGALVVMAGVIWALFAWAYSTRLAAKDGTIESLRNRVADFERKLDGKTPDEVRGELTALRDIVADGIGFRWTPLSPQELQTLSHRFAAIPDRDHVKIMYQSELGKDLAESIGVALRAGGWTADVGTGGGFHPGINTGRGQRPAMDLKSALEQVGRLGTIVPVGDTDVGKTFTFIGIGIKRFPD